MGLGKWIGNAMWLFKCTLPASYHLTVRGVAYNKIATALLNTAERTDTPEDRHLQVVVEESHEESRFV